MLRRYPPRQKKKKRLIFVIDCDTMEDSTEDEQTKDGFIKMELEEEYSLDVFADDLIEGNQMWECTLEGLVMEDHAKSRGKYLLH